MSILADFLKGRGEQHRAQEPTRRQVREEWVQAVDRLLKQIEGWLKDADPEHLLQVERKTVEKQEVIAGAYTAPALAITLGDRRVEVRPVARGVVGPFSKESPYGARSQGRVDLTDGTDRFMLYRFVNEQGEAWVYLDEEEYMPHPFEREVFERALVSLLK
jgi:hypothetical protein